MVPAVACASSVPCNAMRRKAVHEHIGQRCEPQPQLVGAQARRRGPVREEIELAFLDAVFHLAAGAIDFLVKLLCFNVFARQRGDDEARIFAFGKMLRLGHDAAFASSSC